MEGLRRNIIKVDILLIRSFYKHNLELLLKTDTHIKVY